MLLVLALLVGLVAWAHRPRPQSPPLTLADEELAPWFPYGSHPVVLPQTFLITPSVTPAPPPQMPPGQTVVAAG